MVFGKQSVTDLSEKPNSISSRSFHLSMNERKPDDILMNQDTSASVYSRLLPLQPDNMPLTIGSRYDTSGLNRSQTLVRKRD